MKKNLKLLALAVLTSLSFSACFVQRPVSIKQADNNPDYDVNFLFEHDGCRVYRFYDMWSASYVYFTTQGDVTAIPNDSTRQQTVTYRQRNDSIFTKKAGQ